jgi:mono/diheme cytochrome c family protein
MMNLKKYFAVPLMFSLAGAIAPTTQAADGDFKMGRLYYRNVCTDCHKQQAGGAIAPSAYTKAEWAAYIEADKHAAEKDSLKHYVSKEYRDSVEEANKTPYKTVNSKKIAPKTSEELMVDIHTFVIQGAKDGDKPQRCN